MACCLQISEQAVTFALYNINGWVLCHQGGECLLCFVIYVFMLHTFHL